MTDLVTGNQIDIAAFDAGMSSPLLGSRAADWVEDRGRDAMNWLSKASQDQEGIGDDILRGAGSVLSGAGAVMNAPGIKQAMQVLDAGSHYGGKFGGHLAKSIGIDPRIGGLAGNLVGDTVTGGFVRKAPKIAGKLSDQAASFAARNIPAKAVYADYMPSSPLFTGKVSREAGGYMGKGTAGLASSYIDPKGSFAKLFRNLKSEQIKGPFKHHHILDQEFSGTVLNTTDYKEVLEELNKLKIYPGDSPKNIIGMMDEKTFGFMKGAKDSAIEQLKDLGHPDFQGVNDYLSLLTKDRKSARRLIDDLFKNPKKLDDLDELKKGTRHKLTGEITPPEIGQLEYPFATPGDWGSYGLPSSGKLTTLQKQQAYANRFKRLGIDKSKIKYNPSEMMLSKDHIDQIHYSVYNSPKFKERVNLLKSVKDGSYYKLNPKEKAEKIAEVYRIQHNVSVNTAKSRLKLIKDHIKSNLAPKQAELLLRDPVKLKEWIIKNRTVAANLGWKDGIPDFKTLTKDPKKISDELRTVFSTAVRELPNPTSITNTFTDIHSKGF